MICSSNMISRHNLLVLAAALGLAACSAGNDDALPAPAAVPGSAETRRLLDAAGTAAGAQDWAKAAGLLNEARAAEPDNPAVWVQTARLRYRSGEHFGALEAARRALELGPQYGPALLLRAQLVRDAHGLAASLAWYDAAIAADPGNPDIWLDYAATLGDLGRNRAMLDALATLGKVAPQDARANYLSAVLAARAGNAVLARSLLERSPMIAGKVPAALLLDALIAAQQGNHTSAAERLEQLGTLQPDNQRVREWLARELILSGREAEVIARFGRGASPEDTSPYLAMLVGRAHERLNERGKAAPWLTRAHEGASGERSVLPNVPGLAAPTAALRRAAHTGDWAGATSTAASLRQRFAGSADIAALSGDVMLGKGDARGALTFYAAAAAVRRSWPLARKAVAAYRQIGDDDAADALLIRQVAGEPGNIDAVLLLAQRSMAWGDSTRARLLLDHVTALGGGNDPAVRRLRAKLGSSPASAT